MSVWNKTGNSPLSTHSGVIMEPTLDVGMREISATSISSLLKCILPFSCFLFYPLSQCVPPTSVSPPPYIQGFSEMLKLAASISAPALVPEASEQETADESKTSLSNAHTHSVRVHAHIFYFCSFLLTYIINGALARTCLHTRGTQMEKHRRSILVQLLQGVSVMLPCHFCTPSYVKRSV